MLACRRRPAEGKRKRVAASAKPAQAALAGSAERQAVAIVEAMALGQGIGESGVRLVGCGAFVGSKGKSGLRCRDF